MTFTKRGRLEIIHEILSLCRKPAKKIRIVYACNLSYEQLQRYLKYLILCHLLTSFEENRREFFQVTVKGNEFLGRYERLENLTNAKQTR